MPADERTPHGLPNVDLPGADTRVDTGTVSLAGIEAGLDALQAPPTRRSPGSRFGNIAAKAVAPLIAVIAVLAVWQTLVWLEVMPIWNLPGPRQVFDALARSARSGQLWTALHTSLQRGILGFLLSVAIGTPLGLLIARVRWVRMAFGPIVTGLMVLPSIAWVPAAIIWFGLSNATVYFVVLMGATPSVINGLVSGVDQVPPLLRRVGRALGAGPLEMTVRIVLPAALPGYVAGLKQGWAFSWRALMAAEIIAVGGAIGFGLGALLQQGRDLANMPLVIATILIILVVGIAIELLCFAPLERAILRRRGLYAETA
ncbi:MAG: ABC transporter permease [Promicromonosporaceae bacterium]|nr:ABC transporter permease [Promicromonosporaceae bacterium]